MFESGLAGALAQGGAESVLNTTAAVLADAGTGSTVGMNTLCWTWARLRWSFKTALACNSATCGALTTSRMAATWALAAQLGGPLLTEIVVEHTHTCYLGERTQRHDWGYGCGQCPACQLRALGFARYRQM